MSDIAAIQAKARELLTSKRVNYVIGYEISRRGFTRPAFIHDPEEVERLVWNQDCTHNLMNYAGEKVRAGDEASGSVAVVVKPCDSRAANVLLAENRFNRNQVYLIGVVCQGIREGAGKPAADRQIERLQARCERCQERVPVVYDTLIGDPSTVTSPEIADLDCDLEKLDALTPAERAEFWLAQFDRCIRCYACRQACPLCYCPTCLYERDDSLWVGAAIRLDEKRTFHLGRAFHLAGRCVDCGECERVCPVGIPISLLNRKLAQQVEQAFGYRAGLNAVPSPFVTILGREEAQP